MVPIGTLESLLLEALSEVEVPWLGPFEGVVEGPELDPPGEEVCSGADAPESDWEDGGGFVVGVDGFEELPGVEGAEVLAWLADESVFVDELVGLEEVEDVGDDDGGDDGDGVEGVVGVEGGIVGVVGGGSGACEFPEFPVLPVLPVPPVFPVSPVSPGPSCGGFIAGVARRWTVGYRWDTATTE